MSKSKAVQDWENLVRSRGCVICGEREVQLHHVLGRKYKQSKTLIGPWYILPLAWKYHDVGSDNPFNVTHWPNRFKIEFGDQKGHFFKMCEDLQIEGHELPFGYQVRSAIAETTK